MLVRPLAEPLGAEIIDLKTDRLSDQGIQRALRDALFEYLVLIIRDQSLGISGQVSLTSILGTPEIAWDRRSRHPENSHVQIMRSPIRPANSPPSASQFWHTDGSFLEYPPIATVLASIYLPDSGGDTLFIDTRSAYETLPSELAVRVRNKKLRYSYSHKLQAFQTSRYGSEDYDELLEHPDLSHPLVRRHPVTERGSLYLDQLCVAGVENVSDEIGAKLLNDLYSRTLVPDRCYRHQWRNGDLLVWDNPSLMHRRGENHTGDRLLHRTTAAGPRPEPPHTSGLLDR